MPQISLTSVAMVLLLNIFTTPALGRGKPNSAEGVESPFTVYDAVTSESYVAVNNGLALVGGPDDPAYLDAAAYSPDGRHGVFLTSRGNLNNNTTEVTLHLATLSNGSVEHRELLTLSSQTNAPPIYAVRWLSNERIGFIGEIEAGVAGVLSIDLDGRITSHTPLDVSHPPFDIGAGFDVAPDGTTVFGVPESQSPEADNLGDIGYIVGDITLAELVGINFDNLRATHYYVFARGSTRPLNGISNATSYFPPFISISPSGRFAIMATSPPKVPEEWTHFPLLDGNIRAGDPTGPLLAKLTLVNLKNGERDDLTGAPMVNPATSAQVVWDEANSRVFLIDQFVSTEKAALLKDVDDLLLPATIEFSLKSMSLVELIEVSPRSEPGQNDLVSVARFETSKGVLEIVRNHELTSYRETSKGWRREGVAKRPQGTLKRPFRLEIRQNVSEPAQMFAIITGQADSIPVGQINGAVRSKFNPARLYKWTDEAGRDWTAGLILPAGVVKGQKLPLVIQTHSFSPDEFVITGTRGSSAGFSGQALASAGFAVLNMGRQHREIVQTDVEFDVQADGYRSAITALTNEGIIDPNRVGVAAWSRSGLWIQPALASEDDLFAAAIASDAASFGKWSYLYYHNWQSSWHEIYLKHNGGAPFGVGLDRWQERDPVTRVEAFRTPLLITRYGEGRKFPSWWEPYVAMKEAGEPVEYFILPNAPHNPIQPRHRLRIQTMSVDWFRFWLQGYEDSDPAKADQYRRWQALRADRCGREDLVRPSYCQLD